MKKKKVLFLCSNMNIGGFQKSLINLLMYFNYDKFEVDLFLVDRDGIFTKYIDDRVNVFGDPNKNYFLDYKHAWKQLFLEQKYMLIIKRTFNLFISLLDKGYGAKYMSKVLKKNNKKYDVCIDYCGQYLNYYMIDFIDAKKKITYFHNDYSKWDKYYKTDRKYYKKVDYIVTVSEECVESLKKYFPQEKNKIRCIENIITKKTIQPFLNDNISDEDLTLFDKGLTIVSVGRVCQDKGVDLAIKTCVKLIKSIGEDFNWIWVGPGNQQKVYKDLISECCVENVFKMVGSRENPYIFIEKGDIIIQPSRFEGKAVSVEEALVMGKVVVLTDYSTASNQVNNGVNGLIVDFNVNCLTSTILKLINDNTIGENFNSYLMKNNKGNDFEIEKLYLLIGEDGK